MNVYEKIQPEIALKLQRYRDFYKKELKNIFKKLVSATKR